MAKFAVIDMKSQWILSVHTRKELAEVRLRAYVKGIIHGGGTAAVAPWLPPGSGAIGIIPQLRVVAVGRGARKGLHLHPLPDAEMYETAAQSPTKKTA